MRFRLNDCYVSFLALNTKNFVIIPNYLSCLISIFAIFKVQNQKLPIVQHGHEEFVFIFGFQQIIKILLQDKSFKCKYNLNFGPVL